ncbi:AIPR family protein [Paenibacillus sp. FSL k6-2145]|uniref:AIPR family protein n=1 Tax=Paenibacillus sp. FSL k6-2145 TaxID=2976834 RepID=UPI0030DC9A8A
MKQVQFRVESLRKIPNPYGQIDPVTKKQTPETYITLVDVREIPDNIPTQTNPREQNLRTKVAGRIKEGLIGDNNAFFLLNRGLLLSAKEIKFDNVNSMLTIFFENEELHGNVDGGHTYKTILQNRESIEPGKKQFVKLEILTGIEDIFEDVAAARNTSVQVQDSAIAELKDKFDVIIKETVKNEPFSELIAYKENEEKPIEVGEILTVLHMFNLEKYPDMSGMPVTSFSGKQACIKNYIETYDNNMVNQQKHNPYYKMRNVMVDIFKLYDEIESKMDRKYREAHSNGAYGRIKGVDCIRSKTKYYGNTIEYRSPKGFIYPIVGAFRALLVEKNDQYEWREGANPFEYFDELGKDLVVESVERSRTLGNNPGAVGKDTNHWKQLYQNVLNSYLMKQMNLR